jgi:hypothetical protein
MPYIEQKDRKEIDPLIDKLAIKISEISKEKDYDASFAGILNYALLRLALKVVKLRFGKIRYWIIAILCGIFKNVADEIYRRIGTPYEDMQKLKNKDVDIIKEFDIKLK